MAMLPIQRKILNEFSDTQPALKSFGQLTGRYEDDIRLGDLIAGSGLDESLMQQEFTWSGKLPAPDVSPSLQEINIFRVPADGTITYAELSYYKSGTEWLAGTSDDQRYYIRPCLFYAQNGNYLNIPANLLTGVENAIGLELPIGYQVGLFTIGNIYTITAAGKNIVIDATTSFENLPAVGDLLQIDDISVDLVGPNFVNVGVYKVTEVTSKQVLATKLNRTNPVSIPAYVVSNPNQIAISPQSVGMPATKGDQAGFMIQVPAAVAIDISKIYINLKMFFMPKLPTI